MKLLRIGTLQAHFCATSEALAVPRDIIKENPNPKVKIFFILYFPLYSSCFHLQLLYKLYILIIRYEYKFPCIYRIIISPSLSYGYNERQGPAQPLVEKRLGTD